MTMHTPKAGTAVLAAVITVIFWGLSFLSTKVLLQELSPITIAFSRFFIASAVLLALLAGREPGSRLRRADMPQIAFSGFLGTTLYFIFENTGLKHTSASNAVLITAVIPAISVWVDHKLNASPISSSRLIGVATSVIGVLIVVGPETLDIGSSKALGNILMFGAALSWVAYNEAGRLLFGRYSKLALTAYQMAFGALFLFPMALVEVIRTGSAPALSASGWANLLYLAILCSALGYFLYNYALDRLGTAAVTSYLNIAPIVGVLGSVMLLHERLIPLQIIGGAIIITGVWLANRDTGKIRSASRQRGSTTAP